MLQRLIERTGVAEGEDVVAGLTALGLLIYLVAVLVRPERF